VPEKRRARRSLCPHCGKETPTERGVCTNCWGSKGGRLFTVRKRGPESGGQDSWLWWTWPPCLVWVLLLGGVALSILVGWI